MRNRSRPRFLFVSRLVIPEAKPARDEYRADRWKGAERGREAPTVRITRSARRAAVTATADYRTWNMDDSQDLMYRPLYWWLTS
jgi:hypothetical protein